MSRIQTLMKHLTKYYFFMKLPQILHIHKNHNSKRMIGNEKTNCSFYPINHTPQGIYWGIYPIFASCEPLTHMLLCLKPTSLDKIHCGFIKLAIIMSRLRSSNSTDRSAWISPQSFHHRYLLYHNVNIMHTSAFFQEEKERTLCSHYLVFWMLFWLHSGI